MLLELWAHGKALDGADAHDQALAAIRPSHWAVRVALLAPLLFHAAYGIYLAASPRYNVRRYPLSGNWTYTLQRASGVAVLAFVILHASLFWGDESGAAIAAQLSSTRAGIPWLALVYMLGVAAGTFHLAAGCWTFCIRWGLTPSARAQAEAGVSFGIIGVALFLWGASTVVYLATGWRVVGEAPRNELSICEPTPSASAEPQPKATPPRVAPPTASVAPGASR
jgi:succinate dehydrogenase / fumarate reductase cytochrome b subunit